MHFGPPCKDLSVFIYNHIFCPSSMHVCVILCMCVRKRERESACKCVIMRLLLLL